MISQIKDKSNGKIINSIKDSLGRIIYEAWKLITKSGIPPLSLLNSKGDDLVDYKVYGNSVQDGTPMPDTPIEIQSIGEKTKNLFDKNKWVGATEVVFNNVDCLKINDNTSFSYTVDGDNSSQYMFTFKIYRPSGNETKKTNLVTADRGILANITHDTKYSVIISGGETIFFSGWGLEMYIDLSVTQLEEGDTATEYEPYGYKVPVKVSGKNLFNKEVAGNSENWEKINYRYFPIYVGAGNNVTISYGENLEVGLGFYIVIGYLESHKGMAIGTWLYHSSNENLIKTEVTVTADNAGYIYLNVTGNATNLEQYIFNNNFQIEINPTKTEYEPYVEPITTNIYLDEPLRKIDEYQDYIEFENKKVVRNIKEKRLLSTDSWQPYIYNSYGIIPFRVTLPFMGLKRYGHSICSHFSNQKRPIWVSNLINIYSDHPDGNNYYFNTEMTTLDEWKEWLDNNELILDVILETPTEETIELPNIPTIKGTTIIEVDTEIQPSNAEVIYKGKN